MTSDGPTTSSRLAAALDADASRDGRDGRSIVLLDVPAAHLDDALEVALQAIDRRIGPLPAQRLLITQKLDSHADLGPTQTGPSSAIIHDHLPGLAEPIQILLRFAEPITSLSERGRPCWFLWILMSAEPTHRHMDIAAEFGALLAEPTFLEEAVAATTATELEQAYERGLARQLAFDRAVPPELQRTGKLFGGVLADLRRRLPLYGSDFKDGLNGKTVASVFFLFFACLAPAVAFGGLLEVLTAGQIGAIEMIVATAVCGVVYALFSGQPLTILGSTGPVIIFMGILYSLCEGLGIPYMPTLACVGMWTMLFLLILSATDACSWIRYFTRFTDDTFAALISLIFIYEALKDIVHVFSAHQVQYATALLSLVLALGTFGIASSLSQFRRSVYLRRRVREFLADFGPTIAIFLMTCAAFWLHEVELETLAVPDTFATTSGRGWFVNPLDAPPWVWGASAVPAVLVSILLYLDQNITVRLVNNPEYKLRKGAGYHLDLGLVGILVGVCSIFGLPWMVAATVRSLNHVRSLAVTESTQTEHGIAEEKVVGVIENRVSPLLVHLAVCGSLLILPALGMVPMSVLFGLFLFMGVASMAGNQLFERLKLWAMDPAMYPPTYYLRAVPTRVVHRYTAIQTGALVVLWVVKTSAVGILFPLFIGLLVPVRMLLGKLFKAEHLALLDAEEEPEDEEYRETD